MKWDRVTLYTSAKFIKEVSGAVIKMSKSQRNDTVGNRGAPCRLLLLRIFLLFCLSLCTSRNSLGFYPRKFFPHASLIRWNPLEGNRMNCTEYSKSSRIPVWCGLTKERVCLGTVEVSFSLRARARENGKKRTGTTVVLYHSGSPKWTRAAIGTNKYKENLNISRLGPPMV